MKFINSLKIAIKEFIRNFEDDKDKVQPPYGNQYNSRTSQKTSNTISKLIMQTDNDIFENIKIFDEKRRVKFPHAFSADWIDMLYIIGVLQLTTPKRIVELGSGVSTCTIASVLSKFNYKSEFISLDDSKEWGDLTESLINSLISSQNCAYKQVISPVNKYKVNNIDTLGYEHYPQGFWDFIFIDGPPLDKANCSLDPIRLNSITDQTIIQIDGRNYNVKYLSQCLKISKDSDWKRYRFAYPSDDTIFINVKNRKFSEFLSLFKGSLNDSLL